MSGYWGKPSECNELGFKTRWRVRKARGLTAATVWSVFSPDGVLVEDFGSWREAHKAVTEPWTQLERWMEQQ